MNLPSFLGHVLEMIRQPLEEGTITVSRAKRSITYFANFLLVASCNPCPCGFYGSETRRCKCTPGQIERYMSKISGPLVDRIDIHIDVPAVSFSKLRSKAEQINSATIRADVVRARNIQASPFRRRQSDDQFEIVT